MTRPRVFVCDAQMRIGMKSPITRALKARGLFVTADLTASSAAVVCIDGDKWHEDRVDTASLDAIAERRDEHLIVPVILSRSGTFPNPLPEFLWERQAAVLEGIDDEAGLNRVARAIGSRDSTAGTSESPPVFVCYNSADRTLALELVCDIESSGRKTWVDRRDLQPGERWKETLTAKIRSCGTLVFCVGPDGISDWQRQELRTLTRGADLIIALLPPLTILPAEVADLAQTHRAAAWVPGQITPVTREVH